MRANDFVKKFGWDAAKRLVENNKHTGRILSPGEIELTRLVESHELVEKHGGLELSKKEVRQRSIVRWVDPEVEALRQAIADVESCL